MATADKSSEIIRILEDNAGIIFKLSFLYANSGEEAKDLRQEISYQLVKSFDQFKGESKMSTWVYKVALYTALAHLKAKKKTGTFVYDIPELAEPAREEDHWQEVMQAIRELAPVDRSLTFLFLENKSYAEMAEIMGMSESNIGVRLNRIKKKLKEKLT